MRAGDPGEVGMKENTASARAVIRRARPDEGPVVAGLTDRAYAHYIPLLERKPQPMTADCGRMIAEDIVWLLLYDGEPAGVLVLVTEPACLLIYNVAVDPPFQGRGIGRRLLDWAEAEARRAGCARLRLHTNEHMTSNLAMYRRRGYRETGREAYLGSDLVHMEKRVEAGPPVA
jgi:GNAT superfamily N-acetyltransferase